MLVFLVLLSKKKKTLKNNVGIEFRCDAIFTVSIINFDCMCLCVTEREKEEGGREKNREGIEGDGILK